MCGICKLTMVMVEQAFLWGGGGGGCSIHMSIQGFAIEMGSVFRKYIVYIFTNFVIFYRGCNFRELYFFFTFGKFTNFVIQYSPLNCIGSSRAFFTQLRGVPN